MDCVFCLFLEVMIAQMEVQNCARYEFCIADPLFTNT